MTHKVTVRFGGAADSEVHDYSDRIRLLGDGSPLISGGMQCDNGSPGMGQLILDDVENDIPHRTEPPGLQLAAHNQLIWSEDSPGYESWLSIGRIDNKSVGRPHTYTAGVERQWTVQWADANIDFDGLTLTEDWVRPAETDVDRVLAAVAAFCNGSPRLTTVFQTHLVSSAGAVTMPAKTYPAGTELPELFDDCASVAGKVYSVVIHDQSSASHTCLLYIDEEDHTTYPCTLSISDQLDEVDGETVFEPVWRQGGATEEQGQELITGLVSRYGLDTTATAVVTDSDHADLYDYWVKPYNDDLAASATEATNRATAMVHSRWNEHVTHQPSILIPARLHHLLKAGMSINIKSAAAMGGQYLNTVQTRRIANIEWSHAGWRGSDAMLWANLQLDRTPRKLPLSSGTKPGPKPPTAGTPGTATTYEHYTWDGTGNNPDANEEEPINHGGTISGSTGEWYSVVGGGVISSPGLNGTDYKHGVNHDNGAGCAISAGTRFTWSWWWSAFNDPVYFYLTYYDDDQNVIAGPTLVATGSGGDAQLSFTDTVPTGATQMLLKGWTGPGPSGVQATYYVDEGLIQTITDGTDGDSGPTLGGPGDGELGDSDKYVPIDTVIEHGDLSGDGGIMHDASQIAITDDGGYFDAGSVEGALAELATAEHPPPETPFDGELPRGFNLTKEGVVLSRGGSSAWDQALVESPNIFWDPKSARYGMVYVGYSGANFGAATNGKIGLAWSDSPGGPWTKDSGNPILGGSGSGADSAGATGPLMWYEDGTYYLFYIGLTSSGYEGGTKSLCVATTTDLTGTITWTRHKGIIVPTSGWRSTAIYHPSIVKRSGTYYLFFNAKGSNEQIGYATSTDLLTWTVDDTNSPVVEVGGWASVTVGDPYVYRMGETWYMVVYGGPDGSVESEDRIYFTSDADFPLGWTLIDVDVLLPGPDSFDLFQAHKPAIWISPTTYYHYYTATDVTGSSQVREIALATESLSAGVTDHGDLTGLGDDDHTQYLTTARHALLDHSNVGRWEVVVSGSGPPVAVTNEAQDDWLYGWVSN